MHNLRLSIVAHVRQQRCEGALVTKVIRDDRVVANIESTLRAMTVENWASVKWNQTFS